MNFAMVAWLDPFELAASLRPRLGLFRGEGGRRVMMLRGPRGGADPDDETAFVSSAEMRKWPELKAALARIEALGAATGGIERGMIFAELLMPGATIGWQREDSAYAQRFERAHWMLRTNPQAAFFAGAEIVSPSIGWLTAISRRVPVAAINLGETMRVSLVLDFRRKDTQP